MSQESKITRRGFNTLCVSALSLLSSRMLWAREHVVARRYPRVKLVNAANEPIRAGDLQAGMNYIFHYPHATTPCFLIDLGKPVTRPQELKTEDGRHYRWEGGVGPQRSIVSFSAICAHLMTHPTRQVSFINYRHHRVSYIDKNHDRSRQAQVIYCCSEKSVYDVTQGARVIGGPAPQPLAVILLDYDEKDDALYATGTKGGEMFDAFFAEHSFRLALEYQTDDVRRLISGTATVLPLSEYCDNQILC